MALQTIAVEFRVAGDLDGVTPLDPNFQLDPLLPLPAGVDIDPDSGVYVVEVPGNLGLIDPTFFRGSAYADRFIKWMFIDAADSANLTAAELANVVTRDNDGNVLLLESALTAFVGTSAGAYKKRCTYVPQGGLLQVQNVVGPSTVRMGLWRPEGVKDLAAMRQACCCREGGIFEVPDGQGGVFELDTNQIPIPAECRREVQFLKPNEVTVGANQLINIRGDNFEPGDTLVFLRGGGPPLSPVSVTVVDEQNIEVLLGPGSYPGGPGSYTLTIGPPEQLECAVFVPDALTVNP